MKKAVFLLLIICSGASFGFKAEAQNKAELTNFFDKANSFLNANVQNGLVDYAAIHKNQSDLNNLINTISSFELKGLSKNEKKAFYINAYNLLIIKGIIEEYPVNSPQQIPGFFDAKKHSIAGEMLTVNQIEKERLSPKEDPRLHFVLVCGAKSCPIIEGFVYLPESLEKQLDQQSKKAINDAVFTKIDKENKVVELSKIFSWYKTDFTANSSSVIQFVNSYRTQKIPEDYKVKSYEYDWSINGDMGDMDSPEGEEESNLLAFTPSSLFSSGQYEINVFNGLYSQTKGRDIDGDVVALGETQSFLNTMIQFTTGLSKDARFNVGLDVNLSTARYSNEEESGFKVFSDETTTFRKTVVASIGPRIKFNPFSSIPRLSVQTTFLIPVAKDLESPKFINHDRYTWFTQIFYDQSLGDQFQLFLETDFLYRIRKNDENGRRNFFRVPLSAFLSYFPDSKSTIFVFSQYSPRYETLSNSVDQQFGLSQWFTQVGVGAKYQLSSRLGAEVSYGNFALSRNDGAGYNVNFGLRYIYK